MDSTGFYFPEPTFAAEGGRDWGGQYCRHAPPVLLHGRTRTAGVIGVASYYTKTPAAPAPPRTNSAYTGTYDNSYYGQLVVLEDGGKLALRLEPPVSPTTFPLTHFDGDTFSFEFIGENANGLAGALFAGAGSGSSPSVTLDFYDRTGLGTFTRAS